MQTNNVSTKTPYEMEVIKSFISKYKNANKEDLIGPISGKVHVGEEEILVFTSVSEEDYERLISQVD